MLKRGIESLKAEPKYAIVAGVLLLLGLALALFGYTTYKTREISRKEHGVSVYFKVSPYPISGRCIDLKWRVEGATSVALNGWETKAKKQDYWCLENEIPTLTVTTPEGAVLNYRIGMYKVTVLALLVGIGLAFGLAFTLMIPLLRKWLFAAFDPSRTINGSDVLFGLVTVLFALMFFLGHWRGIRPYFLLSGDAANIAGFAAATKNPDLFVGDELLADPENFRFYYTIHVPLLNALEPLVGDYGTAFMAMLPLHSILQIIGFYVLGRVLFKDRWWALLLAVINIPAVRLWNTFWGLGGNPIPRVSFQSVLPWVLAAAIAWRNKPRRWPWLMIFAGLMIYLHPVSTPAWAMALWLGLWFFQPKDWTWPKRIGYMFLLGVIFLVVAFPFLRIYLTSHDHGAAPNYDLIWEILNFRFIEPLLDVRVGFVDFVRSNIANGLLPLTILGLVSIYIFDKQRRDLLLLTGMWALGVLFVSAFIPYIEQTIARIFELLPLETELVRGMRYLYLFFYLYILWGVAAVAQRYRAPIVKVGTYALGLALVVVWVALNNHFLEPVLRTWGCWENSQFTCEHSFTTQAYENAFVFLREEVEPGATIMTPDDIELIIRYLGLHPLVYAEKDGGSLGYVNHVALVEWYRRTHVMQEIRELEGEAYLEALIVQAQEFEADYIFMRRLSEKGQAYMRELGGEVRFENRSFTLIGVP